MSIELKQAAQKAVDAFDAFGDVDDFASLFELTQKMRALSAAIQQAEAQQPADGGEGSTDGAKMTPSESATLVAKTLVGAQKANAILRLALKQLYASLDPDDWMGTVTMQTFIDAEMKKADEAYIATPATGEPVQADSSGHLRVIASLGAALRRLSFAAQTTGGTDGPDAELQSAIGQAEQALSLGGIWQAMSATGEPVAGEWFCGNCRVPVPSPASRPAPSVPADVMRDAERWRTFLATRPSNTHEVVNAAIDAAIDAAKTGGAP